MCSKFGWITCALQGISHVILRQTHITCVLKIINFIEEPDIIEKILRHLDLWGIHNGVQKGQHKKL